MNTKNNIIKIAPDHSKDTAVKAAQGLRAPWLEHYGDLPRSIDYPDISMVDFLEETAKKYPNLKAYEFMDKSATYRQFMSQIHQCAKSLRAMGIREGDKITICLPNTPQAIIMFYAVNMIGALSNMIHPLSSEGEIKFYINDSDSVAAITLDAFYGKFAAIRGETGLRFLLITGVDDFLSPLKKAGFKATSGRKIKKIPKDADIIRWQEFFARGLHYTKPYKAEKKGNDPAVILYSGGTTGKTKGIFLSNLNFNALAMQTASSGDCIIPGHIMLAIMPVFHGFGLGIGIHTGLTHACRCLLVPKFNAQSYAKLLKKKKPNYIAGVPTLYEALLRNEHMNGVDLSCLEGMFSGGDSLSIELKKKVDTFLKEHNATVQVREGYGTTECVTASCLTPKSFYKEGSIGIPFPDTYYKIVKPSTCTEVEYGELGEICISGPTVMLGYVGQDEETADTLKIHEDGRTWLHTGDLGSMDEQGFIYFKQRLKRMIVSSGYSIYPSQLENTIDSHSDVLMSTVIGVSDPYKIQKVKAFVVLRPDISPTEEVKKDIYSYCAKNIAKYAMPYEFEYRESLPTTLVGKIAYTVLEAEERAKAANE